MKPHDKLTRARVEKDLGTFKNAAPGDGTGRILRYTQRNAVIMPVVKVGRSIDVNPDVSQIPCEAGNFVLAMPIIKAFVEQDAPTVSIDVNPLVIRPEITRSKGSAVQREHIIKVPNQGPVNGQSNETSGAFWRFRTIGWSRKLDHTLIPRAFQSKLPAAAENRKNTIAGPGYVASIAPHRGFKNRQAQNVALAGYSAHTRRTSWS